MSSQKFEWKDGTYTFADGKLQVDCRAVFKRFQITDFERRKASTLVIVTDTFDCYHLAEKQFLDFSIRERSKPSHR